jgi:hypothetical protein
VIGSILQWYLAQTTGHGIPKSKDKHGIQWWTSEGCGGLSWAEKERQRLARQATASDVAQFEKGIEGKLVVTDADIAECDKDPEAFEAKYGGKVTAS